MWELQQKEKLNPKDDHESRTEFLKRFDWTDTLLNENEKHAVEDILVEYHDIFARHRMDIGMNTEFKGCEVTKLFTAKAYQCRST